MAPLPPDYDTNTEVSPMERSGQGGHAWIYLVAGALGCCLLAGAAYAYAKKGAEPQRFFPVFEDAEVEAPTQRTFDAATIEAAVPEEGRFVAADLVAMKLFLYEDGDLVRELPILTKGRPGTPFETPSGLYKVRNMEENHYSTISNVYLPYSMQFYGNYFIHGWPYYPDGSPVASSYSGGCIRLSTEDASVVFDFVERGTKLLVLDSGGRKTLPPLTLSPVAVPRVSAQSYLAADLDTGQVYLEKNASTQHPIASLTMLMTALVANETINYERRISLPAGDLDPQDPSSAQMESVVIGKLFYPLLMESNDTIARTIADHYDTEGFVAWMNSTAPSLGMASTRFADADGASPTNVSTADDLYHLAKYLANKKAFILKITHTPSYTLTTAAGNEYELENTDAFSRDAAFIGGKADPATSVGQAMLAVFLLPTADGERRVALIVLQSEDYERDITALKEWFVQASAKEELAQ